MPRVSSVSGQMTTTTSACGSSAGRSVERRDAVARAARDPQHVDLEAGEPALDRLADRAVADDQDGLVGERVVAVVQPRRRSPARGRTRGCVRRLAMIRPTTSSAVLASWTPRALQSVGAGGQVRPDVVDARGQRLHDLELGHELHELERVVAGPCTAARRSSRGRPRPGTPPHRRTRRRRRRRAGRRAGGRRRARAGPAAFASRRGPYRADPRAQGAACRAVGATR